MSPAAITIIILLIAVVLFVTEKLPVNLTILLTMVSLVLLRIVSPADAIKGFASTTILMLIGVMIVGSALFETGVCDMLSQKVVQFAKTERQMIMAILVMTTIMSAGLSNSGTVAVFIPVIVGISVKTSFSRSKMLMSAFIGSMLGGRLTLVGDASINALVGNQIEELGTPFGFFEITKIGLPLALATFVFMYFIGYRMLPVRTLFDNDTALFETEVKTAPRWKQIASVVILLAVFVGMIFENQTGIPSYMVAIIGAVVTVLIGIFNEKQAYALVSIKTIILLGGMTAMATALSDTGAAQDIADLLIKLIGGSTNVYFITVVISLLTVVMTQFMSNVVTVTLLMPIVIAIANTIGCRPESMLMVLCVSSTLSLLSPIACPPANLIYSYGGYRFTDYFKSNWLLIIVSIALCVVLCPILWPLYG